MVSKYTVFKMTDLYDISSGLSKKREEFGFGSPFLSFKDIFNNVFVPTTLNNRVNSSEKERQKYSVKRGDIFLTRTSEKIDELAISSVALFDYPNATFNGFSKRLRPKKGNENIVLPEYMGFYLKSKDFRQQINAMATMSTRASLNNEMISKLEIPIPSVSHQKTIVFILKSLLDKEKLNQDIIANLEELSQVLFKRWFVDFEFPNENGTPYKSNNGIMKESVLGKIPNDWNVSALENIAENYNSFRKPLSKLEREKQENNFPYYGATKVIDYVEDYIFDGKYILVGEDGTVITNKKSPYTQYVSGKFWVSNHAHILKGKEMSDELLLLNLNNINISPFITGAVQPKLNKKNLNSIMIVKAPKNTQNQFEKVIEPIFEKIRSLKDEIIYLTQLRDTLLPKLMSGEIELPDTLEVTEDAELLQRG